MAKESAHFILSGPQLVRVVENIYEVLESQVEIIVEDETCCSKFSYDGTETITDIAISNVNILTLDVDNENLLKDSYKIQVDELLDDYYSKTETYAKVKVYNKTEVDEFLDEKANIGTSYFKTETNELLNKKADKTEIIDAYSKTETDQKLELKADKTEIIDAYSKSEDDAQLLLKADKTDFYEYYTSGQVEEFLDEKAGKTQLIDSYSKSKDVALLLLKADKTCLDNFVDLTTAQTISELQEVRDTVQGKSKGYVFATQEELNDWMAVQDNIIGGMELTQKILETELPDMSIVVTTLCAATGN
ncbi:MAG: hypothetical protein EZS28_006322 [Streblomastix strix]|uniref:Uncharacterized protein n=1 Tax=Streblomastix strix TaxID=222440 RepID=A0A5J4WVE0_9EUKA|nr:MAG: hypothetical protein EZS28_006322 [Streblomastix strix]